MIPYLGLENQYNMLSAKFFTLRLCHAASSQHLMRHLHLNSKHFLKVSLAIPIYYKSSELRRSPAPTKVAMWRGSGKPSATSDSTKLSALIHAMPMPGNIYTGLAI